MGWIPSLVTPSETSRRSSSWEAKSANAHFSRFEEQIEKKIAQARAAEEKLRDFIMETKSYSKEIAFTLAGEASPISPADQELFVSRLLADVNTYLSQPSKTEPSRSLSTSRS